jgi:hypothetical protein
MMARNFIPYGLSALIFLTMLWASCNNVPVNPDPVPVWEDKGHDSVTFTVIVKTQQGLYVVGSVVNLALNQDSLNNKLFIRRTSTDGVGRATFKRLYPRKFFSNCFASFQGQSLFGSFTIQLPPGAIRDTVLIVK